MTSRERNLAIIVGAMAFLLGGWFIQQGVSTRFRDRRNKIDELESKLSQQRLAVMQSAAAMSKNSPTHSIS